METKLLDYGTVTNEAAYANKVATFKRKVVDSHDIENLISCDKNAIYVQEDDCMVKYEIERIDDQYAFMKRIYY